MRHRNGGFKLGRNTSHRRAMLRKLGHVYYFERSGGNHHYEVQGFAADR